MATVSVVQLPHKSNSKGEVGLYLRFEAGGSRVYSSLSRSVLPSRWNSRTGQVRSSHRHASDLNEEIVNAVDKAHKCLFEMERTGAVVTAKSWKVRYHDGPSRQDFWVWADKWVAEKRKRQQIYYWRRARSILLKFEASLGRPLPWPNLNLASLRKWDLYMESELKNVASTRVVAHNIIKTIANDAVREGIIEHGNNPYLRFRLPKAKPAKRVKLTLEQFRNLLVLTLEPGSMEDIARDMFAFSVFARGLRFGDVVRLRWSDFDGDRINLTASKTGDHLSIPVDDNIMQIINKYGPDKSSAFFVFPALKEELPPEMEIAIVSSFNARINKALKTIGAKSGLNESISFHCARHSFAFIAKTTGLTNWEIQDLLKHKKSATTDKYLNSLSESHLDQKVAGMFSISGRLDNGWEN